MNKYFFLLLFLLAGCSENETRVNGRWYTLTQITNGAAVFTKYCASCHGEQAQGLTTDWKKPLADGSYPPPPLNGSAHAWHHPLEVLKRTVRNGGIPLGGKMPPFKDQLNNEDIEAAIAFFQSKWNDKIYNVWLEINSRT